MPLLLYLITAAILLGVTHVWITRLSRAAALVLLLLPLLFTGRALLTGRLYAPVELAYTTEPLSSWRAELHVPGSQNPMLSDITFQLIPWRQAVRNAIASGEWPLLNPFEGCGDVLAGETQPAPFSPFTLLALLLPVVASFGFTAAITFFLAALGTFLLARDLASSELAGLAAAAVFTLSAPIALQVLWPLGFAWAMLPFVLAAGRRVITESTLRSTVILTVVLTIVALGGHPETLLHVTVIGGVYGLYELTRPGREQRGRALLCALTAGVIALLVSSIALLPFLDASRQTVEHFIRVEYFAKGPLRVRAGLAHTALLSDLLPFARASLPPFLISRAEAGSIALALAIFALWRSRARERWFFAILGIVCLLAGAQAWPLAHLLHRVPLLTLSMNDRLACAVPLCLAVLTAFAFDVLRLRSADGSSAGPPAARWPDAQSVGLESPTYVAAILAAVLLLLGAGAMGMRAGSIDIPRFAGEMVPLALAALVILVIPKRRIALGILFVLILAQRTISDGNLVPVNEPRIAYPPLPILRTMAATREPFRIVGRGAAFFPNTATMYGLEDARVMTAMMLTSFDETFPAWCRRGGFGFNQIDDLTRPMLSMLNIRFAIVPEGDDIPPGWRNLATDHGSRLVENEHVLGRAFVPRSIRAGVANDVEDMTAATDFAAVAWLDLPGPARDEPNGPGAVVVHRGGLFDVTMQQQGFVVISESAWSGWRAHVDGRRAKIIRANHAFLAVFVPAGHHTVRLEYLPKAFVTGRAISFGTMAALLFFFAGRSIVVRRR
jgi:hypothetical protein